MENSLQKRGVQRGRRVLRVRKKLRGTSDKPRMCVVRSNKHLSVQLIDDEKGHTLASVSTLQKEVKDKNLSNKSREAAKFLGLKIAQVAQSMNIHQVIFDRGRLRFHGLLKDLATVARETGLQF